VPVWCLLTREQDYAYAQPSLTKKKLRRLEITAGHPRNTPESAVKRRERIVEK
jgi:hypothetical protein